MGNSLNKESSPGERFQLLYNLAFIDVEKQLHNGVEVYEVYFSNEVPAITLLRDHKAGNSGKWNTVPPGNAELADALGALIDAYQNANPHQGKQE